jgi:hypothetical protein
MKEHGVGATPLTPYIDPELLAHNHVYIDGGADVNGSGGHGGRAGAGAASSQLCAITELMGVSGWEQDERSRGYPGFRYLHPRVLCVHDYSCISF